jgi:hypothetical protein
VFKVRIALLSLVVGLSACTRAHEPIAPASPAIDLTPEEYNVFSGYIADTFSGRRVREGDTFVKRELDSKLIIFNITQSGELSGREWRPDPWEKAAESLREKAPILQRATTDSFLQANFQQAFVHRSIRSPIDYQLVTSAELEPIFCKHCGFWPEYYKRFPGATGIVTWSRVGFNSDGTQALFFENYRCSGLCGTGRYVVMEKKNGIWVITTDIVAWVS